MRNQVGAVLVFVLVAGACGGGGSTRTSPSPTVDPSVTVPSPTMTTVVSPTTTTTTERVERMSPPVGFGAPAAQWLRVTRRDGKTQVVAVYRPNTTGEHPVIVVFHGSSGLATVQLAWAANLAAKGYIVVAGCYLDATSGAPAGVFLPCPGLPDYQHATPTNLRASYRALLDVAAGLDGVAPDAIGVVGVSLGAILALSGDDGRVKAIVADSGYRDTPGATKGPVLLLGFTQDPNVSHSKLVVFASAQQAVGNPVESHYYTGAGHVTLLTPSTSQDATARALAFLRQRLPAS